MLGAIHNGNSSTKAFHYITIGLWVSLCDDDRKGGRWLGSRAPVGW